MKYKNSYGPDPHRVGGIAAFRAVLRCFTLAVFSLVTTAPAMAQLRVIVKEGDAIQGLNSIVWSSGFHTEITNSGSGAFLFTVNQSGSIALQASNPADARAVAFQGQPTPAQNGKFNFFGESASNQQDSVAFYGGLTETLGGSSDDYGIFAQFGPQQSLEEIVREGQLIPGSTQARFDDLALLDVSERNSVFFIARDSQGFNNVYRYRASDGVTRITPANLSVFVFGATSPIIDSNDIDRVAFVNTGGAGRTLWIGSSLSDTTAIASEGGAAAGGGTIAGLSTISNYAESGFLAFRVGLSGTVGGKADDRAIFRANGTAVSQVVRKGQFTPSANGRYLDPGIGGKILVNQRGDVAFLSALSGAAGSTLGIYIALNGSGIVEVARNGGAAPGGGVFSADQFLSFQPRCLSTDGTLLFDARTTVVNAPQRNGIYRFSRNILTKVFTDGDDINGLGIARMLELRSHDSEEVVRDDCDAAGRLPFRILTQQSSALMEHNASFVDLFASGFE